MHKMCNKELRIALDNQFLKLNGMYSGRENKRVQYSMPYIQKVTDELLSNHRLTLYARFMTVPSK